MPHAPIVLKGPGRFKDPANLTWERYIALASQLPNEKDWVDVARQHLRKLKTQIKD